MWSVPGKDVAGKIRRKGLPVAGKIRRKGLPAWWRSDGDEVVRGGSGREGSSELSTRLNRKIRFSPLALIPC